MKWLLEQGTFEALEQLIRSGYQPTADQLAYETAVREPNSQIMRVAGNTAEIRIEGVLTQKRNWMAFYYGGGNTTYPEITGAIAEAEADPNVSEIILSVDSGGGQVNGLFDTLAALEAATKPITAVVSNMAASAAYAVASKASTIVAANKATMFGSIGVAVSFRVESDIVTLTSTEAPDKRPDVETEKGKATVVKELDALHELFVDSIAEGRKTSTATINADFGKGAVLLAGEAKKRGMIDSISGSAPQTKTNASKSEAQTMDIEKLKAEHPALYAQIMGLGATAERDRVTAHLTMGEASGTLKTAITAIKDGSVMTMALQAEYMTAGMNRGDSDNRQTDDDATTKAAADALTATNNGETEDQGDTTFAAFQSLNNPEGIL